jgi:hypothetical protein
MELKRIDHKTYTSNPEWFELRSGSEKEAPNCPYGNRYQWIGYDLNQKEYVRFTTTVFKILMKQKEYGIN